MIGAPDQPPVSVTATNTFSSGVLEITKVIEGVSPGTVTATFAFAVACTSEGEALPTRTVTIIPPALVATVGGLPLGATCTVTETGTGGAVGPNTVTPQQVTIGAIPAVARVTAVNTFTAAAGGGQLPATGPSLIPPMIVIATTLITCGLIIVRRARQPRDLHSHR